MESLGSKVAGTIVIGTAWISFTLLFLAFGATGFTFWQNLAVFLVSVIVAGGAIAVVWTLWALGGKLVAPQ